MEHARRLPWHPRFLPQCLSESLDENESQLLPRADDEPPLPENEPLSVQEDDLPVPQSLPRPVHEEEKDENDDPPSPQLDDPPSKELKDRSEKLPFDDESHLRPLLLLSLQLLERRQARRFPHLPSSLLLLLQRRR